MDSELNVFLRNITWLTSQQRRRHRKRRAFACHPLPRVIDKLDLYPSLECFLDRHDSRHADVRRDC